MILDMKTSLSKFAIDFKMDHDETEGGEQEGANNEGSPLTVC